MLIVAWSGSDPTGNADLASALRIARVLRILRVSTALGHRQPRFGPEVLCWRSNRRLTPSALQVMRLLKHLYLSHMSGSRRLLGIKPHTLHVLQLFYVSFIIVNFCGCLWFFVAREADFEVWRRAAAQLRAICCRTH